MRKEQDFPEFELDKQELKKLKWNRLWFMPSDGGSSDDDGSGEGDGEGEGIGGYGGLGIGNPGSYGGSNTDAGGNNHGSAGGSANDSGDSTDPADTNLTGWEAQVARGYNPSPNGIGFQNSFSRASENLAAKNPAAAVGNTINGLLGLVSPTTQQGFNVAGGAATVGNVSGVASGLGLAGLGLVGTALGVNVDKAKSAASNISKGNFSQAVKDTLSALAEFGINHSVGPAIGQKAGQLTARATGNINAAVGVGATAQGLASHGLTGLADDVSKGNLETQSTSSTSSQSGQSNSGEGVGGVNTAGLLSNNSNNNYSSLASQAISSLLSGNNSLSSRAIASLLS